MQLNSSCLSSTQPATLHLETDVQFFLGKDCLRILVCLKKEKEGRRASLQPSTCLSSTQAGKLEYAYSFSKNGCSDFIQEKLQTLCPDATHKDIYVVASLSWQRDKALFYFCNPVMQKFPERAYFSVGSIQLQKAIAHKKI